MSRLSAGCLLLLPATAVAATSLADPPAVGVNPTDTMRSAYSGRNSVAVMRRSIQCVVQRARRSAETLLRTISDTNAEYRLIYGPIASRLDQCSHMGVEVSNILLRGAIAEALFRVEFSSRLPQARGAEVMPIRWPPGHANAADLGPVYELGRCVVAQNPRRIHELLKTEPYSPDERSRFSELGPRLQGCLDAGATFSTNCETIRAVLAEALYQWALAQRAAPAG